MPTPERISEILGRRLIAEESRLNHSASSAGGPAFRVCEKLRRPLSLLTGAAGFRSLLARALTLAKAEVSGLDSLTINPDGSFTPERVAALDTPQAARGGSAIVTQLLGLLITFVGEALTLRLIQDVWPNAAQTNLKTGDQP